MTYPSSSVTYNFAVSESNVFLVIFSKSLHQNIVIGLKCHKQWIFDMFN